MNVLGNNTAAVADAFQWNRAAASSICRRLRSLGPYVLVELILPGGTLIALLLYLYQHGLPPRRLPACIRLSLGRSR